MKLSYLRCLSVNILCSIYLSLNLKMIVKCLNDQNKRNKKVLDKDKVKRMYKREFTVRKAESSDLHIVKTISEKTFIETFGSENTEEDIRNYLDENLNVETVKKELADPDSLFYIVDIDDNIAAYMKLNLDEAQTEKGLDHSIEIQRIYVLEAYKHKGIGKQLMEKAIEVGKQKHRDYIWLGVWEKNLKAITFYERKGFVTFDKHVFKLGDDEQTDYLMKRDL